MNKIAVTLALCLFPALPACSPQTPTELANEGYAALGASDWPQALESFERALAGLEADASARPGEFQRVRLGALKAQAHVKPNEAVAACLAQVKRDEAGADTLAQVSSELLDAGAQEEAVTLMDEGLKRFTDSPELKALNERILAAAAADPNSGLTEQLRGLGYISN